MVGHPWINQIISLSEIIIKILIICDNHAFGDTQSINHLFLSQQLEFWIDTERKLSTLANFDLKIIDFPP